MSRTVLCVDIGTSSLKAALIGNASEKSTLGRASVPSEVLFYSRQIFSKTNNQHSAAKTWMPALAAAVRSFGSSPLAPGAVCISGNGPTIVAPDGTTLLWNDTPQAAARATPSPLSTTPRSSSSSLCTPIQTRSLFIPRLLLFRNCFSEQWARAPQIFSGPEYLINALTGSCVTILPEPRYTEAYWTNDELARCGFSESDIEKLPPFVPPAHCAGHITAEGESFSGIAQGTPVFCGGPDFTSALIGTNTLAPGDLCDRAGSSEGLNMCTPEPLAGPDFRTLPSVQSGVWCCDYLIPDSAKRSAVMEDLAHEVASGIGKLTKAARASHFPEPQRIVITGGQSHNEALSQLKADLTGLPVVITNCSDAELAGDNIIARVGLGEYDSIRSAANSLVTASKTYTPRTHNSEHHSHIQTKETETETLL